MQADLKKIRRESDSKPTVETAPAEIKKSAGYKRWILPAAFVLVAFCLFFIFRSTLFDQDADITPKPIVVISFKNQTGDPKYDYLQDAIPNLLITNLEQSKYLQVITWERIYDLLKQLGKENVDVIDQDLGFEICRMEGVEAIVLGSFVKAGDVFATDIKVLDVQSKRLLKSANTTGEGVGSILRSQIDDLSREVSGSIITDEGTLKGTQLRISDITTSSMEAYHQYIKGRDAYDKWYWEEARQFLNNALNIDSTFAAAYLCQALVNGSLLEDVKRNESLEKAKMYSHLASEKERMYIDAYYARWIENNPKKRLRILEEMTQKYPKEKRIYYNLGAFYHGSQKYEEAIDALNKAIKLDPDYGPAYNQLAYTYGNLGEFKKAEEALNRYVEVSPGDANPYDSMGELYLRMGDFEKAKDLYKKALMLKPGFISTISIGYIHALEEDLSGAMDWINRAIGPGVTNVRMGAANWYKGYYYYLSGNTMRALAEIDTTLELSRKSNSRFAEGVTNWLLAWVYFDQSKIQKSVYHYNKWYQYRIKANPQFLTNYQADRAFFEGLIFLLKANIDSAKIQFLEFENLLPDVSESAEERLAYRYDLLHARILVAENLLTEAEEAYRIIRHDEIPFQFNLNMLRQNFPIMQDELAQAYQRNGDIEKAIIAYEKLVRFDPSQTDWRLRNPRYHYRLGLLYEQRGKIDKATESYEKFLDICALADPNNPEIVDAKNRLVFLRK
jgi:tetratricopeptide (TPR) repeat protein